MLNWMVLLQIYIYCIYFTERKLSDIFLSSGLINRDPVALVTNEVGLVRRTMPPASRQFPNEKAFFRCLTNRGQPFTTNMTAFHLTGLNPSTRLSFFVNRKMFPPNWLIHQLDCSSDLYYRSRTEFPLHPCTALFWWTSINQNGVHDRFSLT